jgi:FkbH-like protein
MAEDLLSPQRIGDVAELYPQVPRLLATLPADDLLRVGRLLSRVSPDEVLRTHPTTPTLTVAVTGHGTLSALVPALTAQLARHGILLRPHLTDHDSYVFELSDPDSELHAANPDLALCVLDPAVVFDEVPTPWQVDDAEKVLAEKTALIEGIAARFAATARGVLVLNTIPLLRRHTGQLVDLKSRARLGVLWREFNARLLALVETNPSVAVVDLDPLVAEGIEVTDARLDSYAKVHLSQDLLAAYAREVGHLARNLAGRTKKCLAVDLDNTVWGGVLGDDGPEGIEIGGGYRGEAFRSFQRVLAQLASQGVLLAAVSKNDPEPVRAVLREHPDMVLREDDFVRVAASWSPKSESIAALAEDLNIGADSFVFADDSPYERGQVRHALPDVAVVDLDDEPALHPHRLLLDGWFDVRELTGEDLKRPAKYRDELVRKDFMHGFDSIADYLAELGVRVRLARVEPADVPRVSQLTLRTNQFNLTTKRLQPAEVRSLLADPAAQVLAIRSGDRFGDNGLVGAVFTRREHDVVHVENFLLSCRVFARGIEQACLSSVLAQAKAAGASAVVGRYRPTAKNGKVRDFFPRNGFVPAGVEDDTSVFRHDLADIAAVPGHVGLTENFGGTP